ncbi:MAG: hypothetical protein AAF668_08585 [Pseudomonadota bacterium]
MAIVPMASTRCLTHNLRFWTTADRYNLIGIGLTSGNGRDLNRLKAG